MRGRISKLESLGAADGPGLRCIVYLQGCSLRCAYCQNPETWDKNGGTEVDAEELAERIDRYRSYLQNGGVTVSGGEPLLQWEFTAALLSALKKKGYHTALDTAGIGEDRGAREVLRHTDLVICDLKFTDPLSFSRHCGGSLAQVYDFLRMTCESGIPLWIRQVIVPGWNDTRESVDALRQSVAHLTNLQKIELLPFRKLCLEKYEKLGLAFELRDTPACSGETIRRLRKGLL